MPQTRKERHAFRDARLAREAAQRKGEARAATRRVQSREFTPEQKAAIDAGDVRAALGLLSADNFHSGFLQRPEQHPKRRPPPKTVRF